ncbi:spermatogenesis associated 6-like protein isoform X3 [Oryzias latipes]|uniref:spermatogenesis associated 6-like protein isoform X3 n=1 Tax=Oryzias latipes TaxID=8090 RepID=UPI000CE25917|nr:spermatogenesis associated 6-like protein isoform X3 [Oryzias latipes]
MTLMQASDDETVRVELVQLIPPAGHLLASFEENTRNFLFPEPKLVPPFSGLDREALMVRAPYFPGIAPRLEFSTKTSITQCLPDSETSIYPNVLMRPETHRKRCPSRRRRMASPEGKPPQTHRGRRAGSADPHSTARRQSLSPLRRRTGWKTNTSQPAGQIPQEDSGSLGRFGSAGTEYSPDPSALLWPNRKPPGSESRSHRVWEEVHERVRGLLTTPRAVRRLIYGASVSEVDEVLARRSVSPDLQ